MNSTRLREALALVVDALVDALEAPGPGATGPAAGPVRMVPPAELLVDARRFQFRQSVVNLSGTDGRLRDCCKWNPALAGCLLVWAEPGGRLCLVDGHHRHRLAMANEVPEVAVLLIDARDAAEARTIGALSNIANGTATAPDVAKLLRDSGMTVAEVAQQGISTRSKVLKDAAALVPLAHGLFAKVCTGELELEMGLALAAAGPHAIQRDLAKEAQRRGWDADQVREAAGLAQLATITNTPASGCLPGLEQLLADQNTNLGELLAVRAAIRRALNSEVLALSTVARKRSAQALEGRGVAVVDRAAAAEARDSSKAQARLFDHLGAGCHGPLQECIRDLARLVDDRHPAGEIVSQNIGRVREAIERELGA